MGQILTIQSGEARTPRDFITFNRGNDPTFVNAARKKVIDLTLLSSQIVPYLQKLRVLKGILLSDHKCIKFAWFLDRSTAKSF